MCGGLRSSGQRPNAEPTAAVLTSANQGTLRRLYALFGAWTSLLWFAPLTLPNPLVSIIHYLTMSADSVARWNAIPMVRDENGDSSRPLPLKVLSSRLSNI